MGCSCSNEGGCRAQRESRGVHPPVVLDPEAQQHDEDSRGQRESRGVDREGKHGAGKQQGGSGSAQVGVSKQKGGSAAGDGRRRRKFMSQSVSRVSTHGQETLGAT